MAPRPPPAAEASPGAPTPEPVVAAPPTPDVDESTSSTSDERVDESQRSGSDEHVDESRANEPTAGQPSVTLETEQDAPDYQALADWDGADSFTIQPARASTIAARKPKKSAPASGEHARYDEQRPKKHNWMRAMRLDAESMERASALRSDGVGLEGDENLQEQSEGTPFGGGNRGLLTGHVCFVEAGTTSVRTITKCEQRSVVYANYLNIAPRDYKRGFPGISQRTEWFAIDFRGEFEVSRSGLYEFNLRCDDGAILWIDGQELIDNDGHHEPTSVRGNVRLTTGKHGIRVHYLQGPREAIALQLFVTPPGGSEQLFVGKF